jgi:sarcosine oxidase
MRLTHDVAVVGLGAMGAATLYQLAKRGLSVVGIDRHAPPHAHGSSHGETRITRRAVGEGADFVPLVTRSHIIWGELERATGLSLFVPCGGLVVGRMDGGPDGFLRATVEVAERCGIEHSLLDRDAIAARYPQFIGLGSDDIAYFEPGAGFVHPEACIEAQLREAARLDAEIRTGTIAQAIIDEDDRVRVETDSEPIVAAQIIVAAGAWTAGLLGAPFDRLLRVTRQSLYWFEPEDPSLYAIENGFPVFIRAFGAKSDEFSYGFPTPDGSAGVKIATESEDDVVDIADYQAGPAIPDPNAFHRQFVAGRLAGVTPKLIRSLSCVYTSTADGRFIIGPHPRMPRVTVISACSGHGFKHSAGIGELVAERIASAYKLAPFALPA